MNPPEHRPVGLAVRRRGLIVALAAVALFGVSGCPRFHAGPLPNPPADAAFLEVDGVHVRYLEAGQGPAVVLLHGYGSAIDEWLAMIPKLSRHYRVIALDLKGFGWTSRPPGDYSPAAQAALVWHLLDQLKVRDVAVIGHSWGASVALAMALSAPERVRRIALFSAYVYEAQVSSFFHWARTGLGETLFALYYRERIEERLPLAFADNRFITQQLIDATERALARPGTVAAALATARGQRYAVVEKRYRTIAQPVLLLWGRDDIVTPLAFAERLVRDLPDARLEVFPHCGHIPMIEATSAASRALLGFLAEEPPPPAAAPAPRQDDAPDPDLGQDDPPAPEAEAS